MSLFAPEGPERIRPIPKKAAKRLFQAEPEEPGWPGNFHFPIPIFQVLKDYCFQGMLSIAPNQGYSVNQWLLIPTEAVPSLFLIGWFDLLLTLRQT